MSEFSFSNTSKKNEFSSILLSDLYRFCFSIFSHPLYFSYFVFFSPYLLKLLSFLSPLFITTTLLLLALLTFSPNLVQEKADSDKSDSKFGFVFFFSQSLLEKVWSKVSSGEKDEEFGYLQEFEAYLLMFQASIFEEFELKPDEDCSEFFECLSEEKDASGPVEEPVEKKDDQPEASESIAEVKSLESLFQEHAEPEAKSLESLFQENAEPEASSLESLFQENKDSEDLFPSKEEKKVKPIGTEFEKVEEESTDKLSWRSGSKALSNSELDNVEKGNEYYSPNNWSPSKSTRKFMRNLKFSDEFSNEISYSPSSLGSYGSMRKEKEWRRTLACKLFEERHNAEGTRGVEGMDMLWETYETESAKNGSMKGKKGEIGLNAEDDEEEDDEMDEGKLCCLQALKFSAGKMNLGMGRPSLVKITKAIKGFGWLHHHVKHGRKGYQ